MRRGLALPVVLFSIALGSALAVGGAYVTRQLASTASTANRALRVEALAERMLVEVVWGWDSAAHAGQPVGGVWSVQPISNEAADGAAWITRVGATQYWLVSEASSRSKPLLRRRLGILVRLHGGAPKLISARGWTDLPY